MFTGLIQALGHLQQQGRDQLKITYLKAAPFHDIALGDSIAVDGVCLTVEALLPQGFIASASPETRDRSTLGQLPEHCLVNLEPSLRVGSKIGGHFVTGHVDGIGHLERAEKSGHAWEISFTVATPAVARYIVPKGSIAVNGISLTVADCTERGDWFKVAVIPVTYAETTLHALQPGQPVNLEGDILGKYVEKFSGAARPADALSLGFLQEHGYA